MQNGQDLMMAIGRVLLSIIFIISGYGKIAGFTATSAYMASKGLPMVPVALVLVIILELGGGLLLLLGFRPALPALGLAVFCIVSAVMFHNFWAMPEDAKVMQQIQFLKNLAIAGGLLYVVAFGPGRFSLDGAMRRG